MNLYQRLVTTLGRTRALGWLGPRVFTPFDQYARGSWIPDSTTGTTLPLVHLTTKGRHSGLDRTVPLLGIPADECGTAVVGTNWGRPNDPAWVHNLRADPHAVLEQEGESIQVVARALEGSEYDRYWERFTAIWPGYEGYRARTDRDIALLVLEEM